MKLQEAAEILSETPGEAAELGADAIAFAQALHESFRQNHMTSSEDVDLNQLENLVDALFGELAAASLFLSESNFSRVPDMLRAVNKSLANSDHSVPPEVVKGFARLATRIEKTRLASKNLMIGEQTKPV